VPDTRPNETPERVLLIRPSALGDVCRTVPVLASLRAAFPRARIDWLVQDTFADAVASHPMLTGVVAFPRRQLSLGSMFSGDGRRRLGELLAALKQPRYDLVIDAQGLGRSGFFAWWTRAPRRVGYANARELGWLGLSHRHRVPAALHSVDRMLELMSREGIAPVRDMRLYVSPDDRASLDPVLRGTRYAVIAPTSRWPGKRWPAERFARVVSELLDGGHVDYAVVVASASERDQCAPLLSGPSRNQRLLDQVGRTTVGELMALIERSAIVVANDSAAVHMAVGFDRPLVGLYGPTRIDQVGPYQRAGDVIQAEPPVRGTTHKDESAGRVMMERITVEQVVSACLSRLSGRP